MKPANTDNIIIVGGGSAGWMVAATLIKNFPNKNISVLESADIPTVGVGESTLTEFNDWLRSLEINYIDFMRETDAAFKFGIGFTNFVDKDSETFYYTFGNPDLSDTLLGIKDWYLLKSTNNDLNNYDYVDYYYKQSYAIKHNRIPYEESKSLHPFKFLKDTAFQVDAVKFAKWLKEKYCIPKGVKHILGTIEKVQKSEEGIKKIFLNDGLQFEADLFVDCSGFKSILLGKEMCPDFIDTKEYLPNNKAWFGPIPYTDKEKEMELFTNCTGLSSGWVWNTPLWSRIGSGYVYCDEYIDDESALEEFKNHLDSNKMPVYDPQRSSKMNFKKINIKNGYYKEPWVKNVVAIGLAHGFLEPLESSGLFFIHQAATQLVKSLSRVKYTQWDISLFNSAVSKNYQEFSDFVSAHYFLSTRSDTPFWEYVTSNKQSEKTIDGIRSGFGQNLSQVYVNFGHIQLTKYHFDSLQKQYDIDLYKQISLYESTRRKKIEEAKKHILKSPTHYQYLKEYIYE